MQGRARVGAVLLRRWPRASGAGGLSQLAMMIRAGRPPAPASATGSVCRRRFQAQNRSASRAESEAENWFDAASTAWPDRAERTSAAVRTRSVRGRAGRSVLAPAVRAPQPTASSGPGSSEKPPRLVSGASKVAQAAPCLPRRCGPTAPDVLGARQLREASSKPPQRPSRPRSSEMADQPSHVRPGRMPETRRIPGEWPCGRIRRAERTLGVRLHDTRQRNQTPPVMSSQRAQNRPKFLGNLSPTCRPSHRCWTPLRGRW